VKCHEPAISSGAPHSNWPNGTPTGILPRNNLSKGCCMRPGKLAVSVFSFMAILASENAPAWSNQGCYAEMYQKPLDPSGTFYYVPSKELATDWSKAKRGDAVAQFNIGFSYENGYLVTPCLEEAKFWYRKAAKKGHVNAQSRLNYIECTEKIYGGPEFAGQIPPNVTMCSSGGTATSTATDNANPTQPPATSSATKTDTTPNKAAGNSD